jgi:ABC-type multidrug transport system ATPase subunit
MSLLTLEHVCKSTREGPREHTVLRDVCLTLESGEYVVVWGPRGSGRSTLLRVAAGIEAPDRGTVLFQGRDVHRGGGWALGDGIGYCHRHFGSGEGRSAREHVTMGLLARGVSPARARAKAELALERCGALHYAKSTFATLERAEVVRVALARTMVLEPRLLVIDDPTLGVDLMQRDEILSLLRTLADEGTAMLASADESTGLAGADRPLALSEGELRGCLEPELATVVPLHSAAPQRATG